MTLEAEPTDHLLLFSLPQCRNQQYTSTWTNGHVQRYVQSLPELLQGLPLASDGLGCICVI